MAPQRLGQGLRLAVDEVIHHDNVLITTIIRPRGDIAARDSHPGDACVRKYDTEEGKASIARRGRDEAAEQQLAVGVNVLHQRAVLTVTALLAGAAPIRLVNVCEDQAKTSDRRRYVARTGHEEVHLSDVAPYRAEEAKGAERAEDGSVRRVVEDACEPGGRSLHEPGPVRRREERAASDLKAGERVPRERCGLVVTPAVPVDLTATACDWPWRIAVVSSSQSSTELIDRALNRGYRRPGCLEHGRRHKALRCVFTLCVRLANWD